MATPQPPASDLTWFRWRRPGNKPDLTWEDGQAAPGWSTSHQYADDTRWLVFPVGSKVRYYPPLTEAPTLFRVFADTEPTEAGFLSFARDYGMLGIDGVLDRNGPLTSAEPFSAWYGCRAVLAAAIEAFDVARTRNISKLSKWISVSATSVCVSADFASGYSCRSVLTIAGKRSPAIWTYGVERPRTQTERLVRLMLFWVQNEVNEWLEGEDAKPGVTPRLMFDSDRMRQAIRLVPSSLASAMWLQLAHEMEGNATFRRCEGCEKWFVIGASGKNANATLCSDPSCKVRAFRKRAREMKRGRKAARSAR